MGDGCWALGRVYFGIWIGLDRKLNLILEFGFGDGLCVM